MNIHDWARKHNISPVAINELIWSGLHVVVPEHSKPKSEAWVQSAVRLEAESMGIRMWRNNVGAGFVSEREGGPGQYLRWGLGNDSKKVNEVLKSGDLIGCNPVRITQAHVGSVIGQFVSRDAKPEGWQWSGTPHELAQFAWCTVINGCGGDAKMVNGRGSFT